MRVDHVIEVRAVGETGEVIKRDPHDPSAPEYKSPIQPKKSQSEIKSAAITTAVQKTVSTLYGYGVSNIGRLSGNYELQDRVQSTMQGAAYIGAIIANPTLGTIYTVTDMALKIFNEDIERSLRNRDIELLRQRTGLINFSGGRQ